MLLGFGEKNRNQVCLIDFGSALQFSKTNEFFLKHLKMTDCSQVKNYKEFFFKNLKLSPEGCFGDAQISSKYIRSSIHSEVELDRALTQFTQFEISEVPKAYLKEVKKMKLTSNSCEICRKKFRDGLFGCYFEDVIRSELEFKKFFASHINKRTIVNCDPGLRIGFEMWPLRNGNESGQNVTSRANHWNAKSSWYVHWKNASDFRWTFNYLYRTCY